MKSSIYDKISTVGGTLALFSGMSIITVVEVIYWLLRISWSAIYGEDDEDRKNLVTPISSENGPVSNPVRQQPFTQASE